MKNNAIILNGKYLKYIAIGGLLLGKKASSKKAPSKKSSNNKISNNKKFGTGFGILFIFLIVGIAIMSITTYKDVFEKRFTSYEPLMFKVEDFQNLSRKQYKFLSNKGDELVGYMYSKGTNQKGIVVIAHGFGDGGHNSYMNCANYFAENGYYVFAYDVTGCDESAGEVMGGVPRGLLDLRSAISFIEENKEFNNLPIVLFGHSWGGYAVSNVLNYNPEVKGVISISGVDKSEYIFKAGGEKQIGKGIELLMPFINMYEESTYKDYAKTSAVEGFKNTDAKIMIVHSEDDDVVPMKYGYDIYEKEFKDDPRFTFIKFKDRGHNHLYNDITYFKEFNKSFDEWVKGLDYDYKDKENIDRFIEDKKNYIDKNLDRKRWADSLDKELFKKFLDFYNESIAS